MIRFTTSLGEFDVELLSEAAPLSCENFLSYVKAGFYNDTVFHRIIPGFVIQGGGMTADMNRKDTEAPIRNEADNGLKNLRGTLSMARTAQRDSATSQFFVNLKDNVPLDHSGRDFGYAVFARVTRGMDVVDAIAAVPTGRVGMHDDVPLEPVVVTQAAETADQDTDAATPGDS
jgi:peptidyl-prolyl cis-trans isomerase A (cyclophilin A)